MTSNKAQEILARVRQHLQIRKSQKQNITSDTKAKDEEPVNQNVTDELFPNSADSGPEARLPVTGPDQGMSPTRMR